MSRVLCCVLVVALAGPVRGQQPAGKAPRTDALGDPLPDGAVRRIGTARLRSAEFLGSVALSPDGKFLAATHGAPDFQLWEVSSQKRLPTDSPKFNHPVWQVAFAPDGKLAVLSGEGQQVWFWDPAAHKLAGAFWTGGRVGGRLVFSPESKLAAVLPDSADHSLRVVEVAGKGLPREFKIQGGPVRLAEFSPDGKKLATNAWYAWSSEVWDVATGRRLHAFPGSASTFTPDGKHLVSAAGEGLTVWDLNAGQVVRRFGKGDQAYLLAVTPDGKTLISVYNARIRIWDLQAGKLQREFAGPATEWKQLVFTADRKLLASLGRDENLVRLWELQSGRQRTPLHGHWGPVQAIVVSADGKRVVSGGMDRQVLIHDLADGKEVRRLTNESRRFVSGVAVAPDGKTVAGSSYYDGAAAAASAWDVATGRQLRSFRDGKAAITAVKFVAEGKLLAGVTTNAAAVLWDSGDRAQVRRRNFGALGQSVAADFTADGRLGATGHSGGAVVLWDLQTDAPCRPLGPLHGAVQAVAFAPDGRTLASGGADACVRVWETLAGAEVLALPGHTGRVQAVAFAPSGGLLAAGTSEGAITLWDTDTGRALAAVRGHNGPVPALAFTPDGRRLVSGGADSTLLVWDVKEVAPGWKRQPVPVVKGVDLDPLWRKLGGTEALAARQAIAALAGNPQLTLRYLREQFKGGVGKDGPRPLRLIEVLERISGGEARELLAELVEVGGPTLLGREARAAWERLGRR